MVDQSLLKQKLALLNEYIHDLRDVRDNPPISLSAVVNDKKTRRFVERTLHLAIECSLDIGNHIIADEKYREPRSNRDIFAVLVENGVISEALLGDLQKMAQFRNLLVHDYARIDPDIIYKILYNGLKDVETYVMEIKDRFVPD
ncbi:DUF86 domain-containing protein [Heliobacterium undosum]|uniref:DUF86 domain-containing protein n=1 Tax=Heliomicrobium undosum TaxID=121734 RepID=A0A845L601_9FIRM|nr:DUF86 domain-containing protein [Heliomicrobium undosum]MZP30475.1 DUF86 domain-containing protein [Heliomicrobium undosum]